MVHNLATAITFALTLSSVSAFPSSSAKSPRENAAEVGYIDVSVATLWTDSTKPRPIDKPALTNPVHIEQWLGSMTVDDFRNLSGDGRTQTQALYGARVDILDSKDDWLEIAVPGQLTPKNDAGYPGWVPAVQVTHNAGYGELQSSKPFALVNKAATTGLYKDADMKGKIMDISYNTRLPVIRQRKEAIEVAIPSGGTAYLSTKDSTVYKSESDIPYPSQQDLITSAKMFLGRPYLWGGTSGFAFDCSGFTGTLYRAHGITIGRDADAQADFTGHGTQVNKADLQPGDLIFYASDLNDPSTIYHVAMYAGNNEMLEAYDSGTPVRITPVRFGKDYWGAERFLTK